MTADDILALEKQRFEAMKTGDADALEALLHRDLRYTHSSGTVDTKESYIRGMRERLWDYRSIETEDEAVSIYGDTAIVHCRLRIDLTVKGAPRQVDSRAITVWIRDGGRWQAVAVHSTAYPKG